MALNSKILSRIIFDLDDTLFDTNGLLVAPAFKEAAEAMIISGLTAGISDCITFRKEWSAHGQRSNVFEEMVKAFGVRDSRSPKEVSQAGFDAFHNREIKESITLFPDALNVLEYLKGKHELYLVTLGGVTTQKKKVKLLHLEGFFKKIFYVDVEKERTKLKAFGEILASNPLLSAEKHLSVGNRIDSEIRDAKQLGFQTILVVRGEYVNLKPSSPLEEADAKVHSLLELKDLLGGVPDES
jgi:FMN phosphatase YigB (HAD superfamily)